MKLSRMTKVLEEEAKSTWDREVKASDIQFESNGDLKVRIEGIVGDPVHLLMDQAHEQVAEKLRIPISYYNRMLEEDKKLLLHNIQTWLGKEPERKFFIRGMGNYVRAILSDRYCVIDHLDVLEALQNCNVRSVQDNLQKSVGDLNTKRMFLNVVIDEVTGEVNKGDVVKAGLLLTNSETGHNAVNIEPRIFRLVCENGLVAPIHTGLRSRFVHLGRNNQLPEIKELVEQTIEQFQNIFERMRSSTDQRLRHIDIRRQVDPYKMLLTNAQTETVEANYKEESKTMWGLVNALTRTGRDAKSNDERVMFEKLAGKLLFANTQN